MLRRLEFWVARLRQPVERRAELRARQLDYLKHPDAYDRLMLPRVEFGRGEAVGSSFMVPQIGINEYTLDLIDRECFRILLLEGRRVNALWRLSPEGIPPGDAVWFQPCWVEGLEERWREAA